MIRRSIKLGISYITDRMLHLGLRLLSVQPPGEYNVKTYGHVILAPSSRGNLGDEAMLMASLRAIRERTSLPVTILVHDRHDSWQDLAAGCGEVSIQGFFSAFGWVAPMLRLRKVLSQAASFSILGADVMDGAYSRTRSFRRLAMAELAIRLGRPTRILGFSFSDKPNPKIQAYLQRLSPDLDLYARDAFSQERLSRFSERPVRLVADTALLLKPADPPGEAAARAIAFARAAGAAGYRTIAFNANPLGSAMSAGAKRGDERIEGLEALVARNLDRTARTEPDCRFIFIAHDPRPPHSDSALLHTVRDRLASDLRDRIFLATAGLSAADVKSVCASCDLTVTGRMHLGIASLGVATPCVFLDFQGKVRGLLNHFGIPEMALDWATYSDADAFAQKVLSHLRRCDDIRHELHERLRSIEVMSAKNFRDFEDR